MKLLTKQIENAFAKLGDISQKNANEIKIICKWFNPSGGGTWYVYDREKDEPDIFWCFANLGDPQFAECGTVSLSELESLRVPPFGLGIERDKYFEIGKYTLKDIMDKTWK